MYRELLKTGRGSAGLGFRGTGLGYYRRARHGAGLRALPPPTLQQHLTECRKSHSHPTTPALTSPHPPPAAARSPSRGALSQLMGLLPAGAPPPSLAWGGRAPAAFFKDLSILVFPCEP